MRPDQAGTTPLMAAGQLSFDDGLSGTVRRRRQGGFDGLPEAIEILIDDKAARGRAFQQATDVGCGLAL